ncbi:MAG: type II secretion system protein M, partial [Candidatus Omnitrophica bacterium]|nr:type II secretion system protein M [Candidatus Omnitrophota bacterium]
QEIESAGTRIGLNLVNLNPLPIKDSAASRRVAVNVEIEGELVSMMRFIHELQTTKSFFFIEELEIGVSSPGATKSAAPLRARLVVLRLIPAEERM